MTLQSSNTAAAQVPANVTIPAGSRSATFTITTSGVASSTSVTITAVYGTTRTTTLTVTVAGSDVTHLEPKHGDRGHAFDGYPNAEWRCTTERCGGLTEQHQHIRRSGAVVCHHTRRRNRRYFYSDDQRGARNLVVDSRDVSLHDTKRHADGAVSSHLPRCRSFFIGNMSAG